MEPYPFKKEELKVPGSKNIYKAFLSPKKLDTINQARNILNIVSHTFQILKKKTIIGDSLSSDIQGGKNAGIKTIWFHRQQDQTEKIEPKPDYEIRSLKLLLDVLR